ncbi:RDD family protein [Microvirga sp. STS03]|uniref:RDD family protein n=1 Tax=Pontibacter TaxID=323449 RepID=UPI001B813A73|nr:MULTISPECIES: RDD family protein [Pontibacter]MBR0569103.1 RDD family protein [Microvirga sp. STS03]
MQTALTLPAPTIKRSSLYGSLTTRFVAFLVDTTMLVFFYTIIFYSIGTNADHIHSWDKTFQHNGFSISDLVLIGKILFFNPYFAAVHWLYYTLLEASPKQATIGKFTLGLKVTDLRGKRITIWQSNLRYFSKLISILPVCLGFLLILVTRRHQMLHDYIARSVVVGD